MSSRREPRFRVARRLPTVALLALGCGLGCGEPDRIPAPGEIVLGAVLPLSGPDAATGESLLEGLRLGAASLGPGPPASIRVLDGEGAPGPSVRAAREFLVDSGVRAIVGGWLTPSARAVAAVTVPGGLAFLSLSPLTLPSDETPTPGLFVLHRLEAHGAGAAIFSRAEFSAVHAGIVRLSDHEISARLADAFAETFTGVGGIVAWTIAPDQDGMLVLPAGPETQLEVIYVAAPSQWALDAVFLGEKGRAAAVVTAEGWDDSNLESLVNIGSKVYITKMFTQSDSSATAQQFLEECREAEVEPTPAAALGWDAARLFRSAVGAGGFSRSQVVANLLALDPVEGATGRLAPQPQALASETPAILNVTSQGEGFLGRVSKP